MDSQDRIPRGDRRFVLRLLMGAAIVLLAATWGFLALDGTGFGDCAARSFEIVTESSDPH